MSRYIRKLPDTVSKKPHWSLARLAVALWLSLSLAGCATAQTPPPGGGGLSKCEKPGDAPGKFNFTPMPQAVADALPGVAVLFGLDESGNQQVFVNLNAKRGGKSPSKVCAFQRRGLQVGNLEGIDTFTVFRTSNPKYCYGDGLGNTVCVVW